MTNKEKFIKNSSENLESDIEINDTLVQQSLDNLIVFFSNLESSDSDSMSYEDSIKIDREVDRCFSDLRYACYEYIRMKEWSSVINVAIKTLKMFGIEGVDKLSPSSVDASIAVTEAINLSAKLINYNFYELKPATIVAAWKNGANFGLGDDDAYYLSSPTIGAASFHDPDDEVGFMILDVLEEKIPEWDYGWSGVYRQDDAYNILRSLSSDGSLAHEYSQITYPDEMAKVRDKYMKNKKEKISLKISEVFKGL
jgi:hypothetical protein